MDTLNKVYRKLNSDNKTELAKHKIELGLIDDIKEEMKQANKGGMKAIDLANDAKKPAEKSLKENQNLLKKIAKTKKAAIELGASDILKQVQKFEQQVKENIKTLDNILSALYRI
tara:strand:+ start:783 stop:1127 length:345 start_codon:yes stop_codon:yes gene_type:complete